MNATATTSADGARTLRIAFARINQETNALSPVTTTLDDFKATHFYDVADELLRICQRGAQEVDGMFKNAELSGFVQQLSRRTKRGDVVVAPVPLLSAWAVPSGPLTRACFDALVDGLCSKLAAAMANGGVDAVYLSLHGAMNVVDLPLPDGEGPESEIVRRVRDVVGDAMPVAVSLDLHGNVTRALVQRCTFVQAYQTNPHRDHAAVGARCADVLVDTVLGRVRPVMRWRSLPMILGGGNTIDFLKPLRPIFQRMKSLQKDPRVLGASVLTVHPWNSHKELGWATLVATDELRDANGALADDAADDLARRCWDVRHQLPPAFSTTEQAIARARRRTFLRKTGVVVFSDASDVVSAGAPGENTAVLRALIDAPDLVSYATIRDPALVDEHWKNSNVDDVVDVTLGCKLDAARGQPLRVSARVLDKRSAHGMGRMVILQIRSLKLVVVEGPALAVRPLYFKNAGLDPWKADVVVVKNFFPFLLFFAPLMRDVVFIKSGGVTDFDAAFALQFNGPVHPRDKVDDWHEADTRRREHAPVSPKKAPRTPSTPASLPSSATLSTSTPTTSPDWRALPPSA
jgi:microcystin degradation protein MlrC